MSSRREGSAVVVVRQVILAALAAVALAAAALTIEPGKASGSITIDGTAVPLTYAIRTTKPNAFDDTAVDTVVILSDRPLTKVDTVDEPALYARGLKGELAVVALRFDERRGRTRLFNVTVAHKSLSEQALLPDVWFDSTFKGGVGALKMARRDFNGHTYETNLEYAVIVPAETTVAATPPPAPAGGALPPPSRTEADRKAASALLIAALQEGDEARSLAIIKLGIDPNATDEKMKIPVINWAVVMCQASVVKELAELKADTTHERIPGMTLLAEAVAACPEAVPYLKAAGAK